MRGAHAEGLDVAYAERSDVDDQDDLRAAHLDVHRAGYATYVVLTAVTSLLLSHSPSSGLSSWRGR